MDPSYTLELKQALTIKPKGLEIRAALRQRTNKISATPSSPLKAKTSGGTPQAFQLPLPRTDASVPLYVLYGSNTGTSESFAQRIVTDSAKYGQSCSIQSRLMGRRIDTGLCLPGFHASLGTLDSATNHLPTDGPIIIVTASFEGDS